MQTIFINLYKFSNFLNRDKISKIRHIAQAVKMVYTNDKWQIQSSPTSWIFPFTLWETEKARAFVSFHTRLCHSLQWESKNFNVSPPVIVSTAEHKFRVESLSCLISSRFFFLVCGFTCIFSLANELLSQCLVKISDQNWNETEKNAQIQTEMRQRMVNA